MLAKSTSEREMSPSSRRPNFRPPKLPWTVKLEGDLKQNRRLPHPPPLKGHRQHRGRRQQDTFTTSSANPCAARTYNLADADLLTDTHDIILAGATSCAYTASRELVHEERHARPRYDRKYTALHFSAPVQEVSLCPPSQSLSTFGGFDARFLGFTPPYIVGRTTDDRRNVVYEDYAPSLRRMPVRPVGGPTIRRI
ncbi:hypothetical protein HPB47_020154 [Ixodes persulcatus]|uniref:Uncharacterized protein n=1 Tax=Ixodes persulcatus TaxID=34615 RepID=A0AC60QID7_IXOPE|nr:hypothetical protein HPB47_020154 [Ixodes persulcatus]